MSSNYRQQVVRAVTAANGALSNLEDAVRHNERTLLHGDKAKFGTQTVAEITTKISDFSAWLNKLQQAVVD